MTDVVFIASNNAEASYQSLANKYSAIEPPTWALLLAEGCRNKGHTPFIIDCLAEQLTDRQTEEKIRSLNPRLICFVVYGQNVNAGTTNMSGAVRLANHLKASGLEVPLGFIGSHVQALPKETLLREDSIDFVFLNEGMFALLDLLNLEQISESNIVDVNGLAVKLNGAIVFTGPPTNVPQDQLDAVMPGYAWDLLPYKNVPLDLYRSPLWHAEYQDEFRSPYAAVQTAIGCQFKCSFCMINLINKNDTEEIGVASNYAGMRHWSIETIKKEFIKLIEIGVKTIRITDEMFLLNRKYYLPILRCLIELNKEDDLRIWVYSRIDTIPSPEILKMVRKAGIRWICLGIESGDRSIRLEVAKGKFEEVDVEDVVKQIEEADINIMANYIFGLPGDTPTTIMKTYQLSEKLNTLGWNTYAAMALPGSPLYVKAKEDGIKLPEKYEEFSFHSYETVPLPTATMKASEILKLRDEKFTEYFSREMFLQRIETKFGKKARVNIEEMNTKKLKRKIIEEGL